MVDGAGLSGAVVGVESCFDEAASLDSRRCKPLRRLLVEERGHSYDQSKTYGFFSV